MEYILEIWHRGECIESMRGDTPPWPEPQAGEQILLQFKNRSYTEEYGSAWIVRKRRHLLFDKATGVRTLQLYCEPDPNQGDPKV